MKWIDAVRNINHPLKFRLNSFKYAIYRNEKKGGKSEA